MNPFAVTPPDWLAEAYHARGFECPRCCAGPKEAQAVWVNRRSPVFTENQRRKWQEFYYCQCGCVWWAWSSDRPPSVLARDEHT